MSWAVEQVVGDGSSFHARAPSGERAIWRFDVDRATLALGSAQPPDAVDQRVADALDVEVVTRRSGGGAVLILPGEMVWIDVIIPAGDLLWADDVGRAMLWVGEAWCDALASVGVDGVVHRDGLVATRWSRQVCFSGVGTGEVLDLEGRKLVGISQRRTRSWARFQTMAHLRWRPELAAALVAVPRPTAAELAPAVAVVDAPADVLADAVVAALRSR